MVERVVVKRVYETVRPADGCRILVDRLWPRGLSRKMASIDYWFKDVAPSDELRKWFGHDAMRWKEFKRCYRDEIRKNWVALEPLIELLEHEKTITLLFAARDESHNNAVVLAEYLTRQLTR